MKVKNMNNPKFLKLVFFTLSLLSVTFFSCEKEKKYPEIVIPTRVSFDADSYIIEKDNNDAFVIPLKLARPLEKDGTITLQLITENTTALETEYKVNHALVNNKLTVSLPKGTAMASFSITSLHNFDDNKVLSFKIVSGTGGAVVGDAKLTTTISLRGNTWVTPSLTTSVTTPLDFGSVNVDAQSTAQSYTLTGVNLSGQVSIKASDNFQVSLNNTTYTSSVNVDANNKAVTVYVKFAPVSGKNQPLSGKITHSLTGLNDIVFDVTGEETGNIANVALLVENFEYGATEDFLLRTNTNWTAYSAEGSIPITYVPQGLNFANYVGSGIGGAATMMNGGFSREDISRTFTSQTSGTVYTALMVSFSAAAEGEFFFANRDAAGGFFNRFYVKDGGSGNLILGVGKNSTAVYSTTNFKYNTTYLVVIKHDFSTKISSMYVINGTIPDVEPTIAAAQSVATGTSPTSLNDVVIRQAETALTATIDGIRVATTWKGVLGK